MLGRWRRTFSADSDLQVEGYFDHTYRLIPSSSRSGGTRAPLSVRYRRAIGRHGLLFGADAHGLGGRDRQHRPRAAGAAGAHDPHDRRSTSQDTVQIEPRHVARSGLKGEQSSFAGYESHPTVRFAWTPNPRTTVWAAVSRAVRTPVRIDEDLVFRFNERHVLRGQRRLSRPRPPSPTRSASRHRPASCADRRRCPRSPTATTTCAAPSRLGTAATPLTFKNGLDARSYGGEVTVMYQPIPRLFFKGSVPVSRPGVLEGPGQPRHHRGQRRGQRREARCDRRRPPEPAGELRARRVPPPRERAAETRARGLHDRRRAHRLAVVEGGWRSRSAAETSSTSSTPEFVTTNSLNEQVHRSVAVKLTWRP